jgi:hypothetical protein
MTRICAAPLRAVTTASRSGDESMPNGSRSCSCARRRSSTAYGPSLIGPSSLPVAPLVPERIGAALAMLLAYQFTAVVEQHRIAVEGNAHLVERHGRASR